jgi:hypothetical protein
MEEKLAKLEELLKIQLQDGNWNYDPYMHGMANGLILAVAIMKDEEPKFLKASGEWLANRENETAPVAIDHKEG